MENILETTQCKLCGKYVCDELEYSYGSYSYKYGLFVHRWDLQDFVCKECDYALGPDTLRVAAMKLCKDPSILQNYLKKFE